MASREPHALTESVRSRWLRAVAALPDRRRRGPRIPPDARDARGRLTGTRPEWFADRPPPDPCALLPSERAVAEALGALLLCAEGRPGVARVGEVAGVAYAATSRALARLEHLGLIGRDHKYNASKRDRFWLVLPG